MNSIYTFLPSPGNVLMITHRCSGIEFIRGYCRIAHFVQGQIVCRELIGHPGEIREPVNWVLDPALNGLEIAPRQNWMDQGSH